MTDFRNAILLLMLLFCSLPMSAQEHSDTDNVVVIGPRNPNLVDGAKMLLDGDIEEGIRLTQLGLEVAVGRRERQAGLSNLCAGHVLLGDYETGLDYCNQALLVNDRNWRARSNRALIFVKLGRFDEATADLDVATEVAPHSRAIKEVRGLLLDATDPVVPNILIDDRRDPDADDDD